MGAAAGMGGRDTPAAGQGGSGASSGSPGQACEHDGACAFAGARCHVSASPSECCSTDYICFAGRWTEEASSCGATACPAKLPKAGTACGPCAANCSYDTCTRDGGGQNLEADCNGTEWVIADLSCLTCCKNDSDCPNGFCTQGRCESRDHGPGCFRDDECAEGQICAGMHLCACGSPAGCKGDGWGECVPAAAGCCVLDGECGIDETCIAGICRAHAPAGSCWTNDDCQFGCSLPPQVCACGMSCVAPDEPGMCWVPL